MIPDDVGQQLHDRATRALPLTPEEAEQLREWYARCDAEEAEMLRRNRPAIDLGALQTEINVAVAQLQETTRQVREQRHETEQLRKDIAALVARLSSQAKNQPA